MLFRSIEGLTVSYMYRNTRMYDTLMQMGRWFGYRPNFEDACRVYLSKDSINWYKHIALASDELRQQIKRMRDAGMSPKDFGLYVQSHPDSLLITAANKMRSGEKITLKQNYTGRLIESTSLPLDAQINDQNGELISKYWADRFGGAELFKTEKGWFLPDVECDKIGEFLTAFKSLKVAVNQKESAVSYLRAISGKFSKGDVLLISVGPGDPDKHILGPQERTAADATKEKWQISGYRVASRGDEKLGLTSPQQDAAQQLAADDAKSKSKKPSDFHYRLIRNKPLLMVHILKPTDNDQFKELRVPAWGLSYPDGQYETAIEVVANRVWIEQMYGSLDEDPDDGGDYDDE